MGQGNETAFTQIVSDRLGVPPERIQVFCGRQRRARRRPRQRRLGRPHASAAPRCCAPPRRSIERGRRIAAHLLEAAPEDVALRDGRFTVAGTDRGVDVRQRGPRRVPAAPAPAGLEPGFSETAAFTPPAVTFPNGCQVCEVEIDEETGAVRVRPPHRGRRRRPHGQPACS